MSRFVRLSGCGLVVLCVLTAALVAADGPATRPAKASTDVPTTQPAKGVLDFTVKDMAGQEVRLDRYRGKVILIVNVASKCGLTPQYKPLQALYEQYADKGLVILAFPANNFGNQEPGSDEQIQAFCQTKYGVTFPVFAKISVKGEDKHPLYEFLTSKQTNGPMGGEITWNFEKFLVSRDGKVVRRFAPKVAPDSKEVVEAIERELGAVTAVDGRKSEVNSQKSEVRSQ